jgi:zeta-carotene desaturase
MSATSQGKSVGIIGGGLAGLAAGCALADAGMKVTLFERRPYVGGRASSYEHPGTGEVVDNCQHVLFGCCTNLIDFYKKLGVADKIGWSSNINFIEPGGRLTVFAPSKLPAPLHNVLAFIRSPLFSLGDKLAIARGLTAMLRGLPEDSSQDFLTWLREQKQTPQAIKRFWEPVLISALTEDLDRISVRYATKVFRELFLFSAEGGKMGVPTIPLSDLYAAAIDYIRKRDGEVLLRTVVTGFNPAADGVTLTTASGETNFDYAVVAAPFQTVAGILPTDTVGENLKAKLQHFEPSPITGIHLWFDREVTPLPHAALMDRTIQWMYQKSKLQENRQGPGSYMELVVSASKSLVPKSREEVLEIALRELAEFFPAVKDATVTKSAVVKEVYAAYAILPGLDEFRPEAATAWPRVFLAGDWTATEWPATMEGAVRSGYLSADAITAAIGQRQEFIVADLPKAGLMKLLG